MPHRCPKTSLVSASSRSRSRTLQNALVCELDFYVWRSELVDPGAAKIHECRFDFTALRLGSLLRDFRVADRRMQTLVFADRMTVLVGALAHFAVRCRCTVWYGRRFPARWMAPVWRSGPAGPFGPRPIRAHERDFRPAAERGGSQLRERRGGQTRECAQVGVRGCGRSESAAREDFTTETFDERLCSRRHAAMRSLTPR